MSRFCLLFTSFCAVCILRKMTLKAARAWPHVRKGLDGASLKLRRDCNGRTNHSRRSQSPGKPAQLGFGIEVDSEPDFSRNGLPHRQSEMQTTSIKITRIAFIAGFVWRGRDAPCYREAEAFRLPKDFRSCNLRPSVRYQTRPYSTVTNDRFA
jgi:hypothetical protein